MRLRQAKKEIKKVARLYALAMCYAPFDSAVIIKRITDRHFKAMCYWYRHNKRNKKNNEHERIWGRILACGTEKKGLFTNRFNGSRKPS